MKCPYCQNEMKRGKIRAGGRSIPYWQEDGVRRSLEDFFGEKGKLPKESFYCPQCKKIIIDMEK